MFLQRFLILLFLWVASLITTNVLAASLYRSSPSIWSTISFDSDTAGTAVSQNIAISNGGADSLIINSATFGLTNASSFSISSDFPLTIPSGSSTSLTVTCSPDLASYLTYANVALSTNDPANPTVYYTLKCLRHSTGALYESYPPKNSQLIFSEINSGTSTRTRGIIAFNPGDTSVTLSAPVFSGPDAANFSIITAPSSQISAGSSTYFAIACSNTKIGVLQANLSMSSNASNISSINYALSCDTSGDNGTPTDISLDNQSINGGSPAGTVVGNLSTNDPNGTTDRQTYSIVSTSGVFAIQNNTLVTSQSIPLTTTAPYSVTIRTTDSGGLFFDKSFNINVISKRGAGFQSNPPSNSLIDLGKTLVLTTTLGQTNTGQLEIIETGDMNLTVSASIIGITNSGGFKVSPASMVVADGSSSQFFTVSCTPTSTGIHSAQLQLTTNVSSTPTTFSYPIQCEGISGASFTTMPSSNQVWTLGQTPVGQPLSRPLQITETGSAEVKITTALKGINANDFKVSLSSLNVPDGAPPQTLNVECNPSALGIRSATLELSSNDPKNPLMSFSLECEGSNSSSTSLFSSAPAAAGQPIDFKKVYVNQSATYNLEITETGATGLVISATIIGTNASDFKISSNSMTLQNGSPPQTFTLECRPQAEGVRNATLQLTSIVLGGVTTSTTLPATTYPLVCEGTAATMFNSNPPPNSLILFNSDPQGTPVSKAIQITNRSAQHLSIDSLEILGGSYATTFKILNGTLPIDIAPQTSFSLDLQCTPSVEVLQGGVLHLTTNDPNSSNVQYLLACLKKTTGSIYASLPKIDDSIYFNNVIQNQPEKRSIFVMNGGDTAYSISGISMTGTNQDVFKIPPLTAPITINPGELHSFDIECNPTEAGLFVADLNIAHNAGGAVLQTTTSAHYSLTCRSGVNNAPTDILLDSEQIKPETSANTLVANISTIDPDINDPQTYKLEDSSGLFVIKGHQLWTAKNIPVNSTAFDIKVTSTDAGGLFTTKNFHLIVGDTSQQFRAEVVTKEGVKTIVDETEILNVKGYIQPLSEEVGKIGDVFVIYQYTSLTNGVAKLPITLLQNVPLEAKIELALYQGRLIYLPGKIDITLGYRINGNEKRGLANTFTIRKNRSPTDLTLSRNTLVERSSAGTTIGTLVAQDIDKDDFFRYVIIKNAGTPFGYFKIVGDQLQMTESFPLTFTENSKVDVGVRAIDGAGGYIDKTFTITVIENDTPHIGGEIRSNGYAIRGTKNQVATLMKEQSFTVNAWIQPPTAHVGKVADIPFKVIYTPVSGDVQTFEGNLQENVTLTSALDLVVAKDFKLDQTGTYDVSIGYKLKDSTFQTLVSFLKFRVQG